MLIGEEAQQNIGLMQRIVREGHEIGNHTYTHPDISEISPRQLDLEVNLTERLFASKLGVQPLYFRPPYDIDEEPDTDDQAAPVYRIQQDGLHHHRQQDRYRRLGRTHPQDAGRDCAIGARPVEPDEDKPQFRGSIILMHDGGGDRSVTVAALPVLIDTLRAHGYSIVQVSALMGKTTAEVMPPLTFWQQMRALPDSIAFSALSIIFNFIVMVFFVGDILMSARLILVGIFAIIDRLRRPHREASPGFNPRVAVLIPAYNEEKVIVRTIRSVLNSDYKNLHVIVIDDGSTDRTAEVAREAYAAEIAAGRVQVLAKPNGGKAAALNYALDRMERGDLCRHRCRHGDRRRCDFQADSAFRGSGDRRRGRQRQGGQPREPVDALAGAGIHHQPELRAARTRPVPRGHGGSGSHRRVAHRAGEERPAATRSTPWPKMPT